MTICNTGSLATGGHGTALGMVSIFMLMMMVMTMMVMIMVMVMVMVMAYHGGSFGDDDDDNNNNGWIFSWLRLRASQETMSKQILWLSARRWVFIMMVVMIWVIMSTV